MDPSGTSFERVLRREQTTACQQNKSHALPICPLLSKIRPLTHQKIPNHKNPRGKALQIYLPRRHHPVLLRTVIKFPHQKMAKSLNLQEKPFLSQILAVLPRLRLLLRKTKAKTDPRVSPNCPLQPEHFSRSPKGGLPDLPPGIQHQPVLRLELSNSEVSSAVTRRETHRYP